MEVIDTNVLIYAADSASEFHPACRARLEALRSETTPSFLTWGICYEFLTVSTNLRGPRVPMSGAQALQFIEALLNSRGIEVLIPTTRHAALLTQTLHEHPDVRGSLFHDLRIAVLMREHGVSRICTRDADFHRFPFLTVVDPLH